MRANWGQPDKAFTFFGVMGLLLLATGCPHHNLPPKSDLRLIDAKISVITNTGQWPANRNAWADPQGDALTENPFGKSSFPKPSLRKIFGVSFFDGKQIPGFNYHIAKFCDGGFQFETPLPFNQLSKSEQNVMKQRMESIALEKLAEAVKKEGFTNVFLDVQLGPNDDGTRRTRMSVGCACIHHQAFE